MSQLNYPLADGISALKRNNNADLFLGEREEKLIKDTLNGKISLSIKRKLIGKIKFIIGLIYFFSLMYLMLRLFI
ncbi:MAG: hypothetical protein WBQ32_09575 [Ignavibacteriaceae bacterium]